MHISEIIGKQFETKSHRFITILKYEVSHIGASTAYCNISLVYKEKIATMDGREIVNKSHINDIIWDEEKSEIDLEKTLNILLQRLINS